MAGQARTTGAAARTRSLLIRTARELLLAGEPLTVQAVADRSGVSRATAYRLKKLVSPSQSPEMRQ